MLRYLIISAATVILLAGCEQVDKNLETEDSRNPWFKKAEAHLEATNYTEAVKDYEEALRANPRVISAHYELGRIYSDKLGDQISAMYHFHKYLELRPAADNRDKVQALLDNEKISFAATLPNSPVQNAEAFARLQSENLQLKKELEQKLVKIAQTQETLEGTQPATPATESGTASPSAPVSASTVKPAVNAAGSEPVTVANQAVPAPDTRETPQGSALLTPPHTVATTAAATTKASVPAREPRSYTIKAGDSLWKISGKFYPGDRKNGVEKIKQANTATLPEGKPLKIGTVLVIP